VTDHVRTRDRVFLVVERLELELSCLEKWEHFPG